MSAGAAGGVRVRTRTVHERFLCPRCGTEWVATYEIRDYQGSSGARWVVHCRDGRPVRGPHLGARCPACGQVSTRDARAPEAVVDVSPEAPA
ncbi:MAG: hypothetical protein ACM3OO_12985 [Planctomycetaceae bacterium]